MPHLDVEERDAFLREPGVLMRIAVVRADGSPLVTPIWFLYRDGAIHFTPRERSEWFACLRRDPRVALCIDEAVLPYRKLVVEGEAELLHDVGEDDDWRDLYHRMAAKYVGEEGAGLYLRDTLDEPRGLYRLVLDGAKLRSWRMPVPGEAPEGIWHPRYYRTPDKRFDR